MKKFKKVLSILLCLVLMAGILPVSALADDIYVAEVNGTKCRDLDTAVDAANSGDTIYLLANCETAGLNLSKNLTIDGGKGKFTVKFTNNGINLSGAALTFKNCTVEMTGIGTTPIQNWMAICVGANASLVLENTTMTMDGTGTAHEGLLKTHAIYLTGGNNALNLTDSKLTIKNFTQDALEWDGGENKYSVNFTNSTFVSDGNRSGFTGTFYATFDHSRVDVINSRGNGSNQTNYIVRNKSEVSFSNNTDHGMSGADFTIDDSTVTAIGNGGNGIHVAGVLSVENNAKLIIKNNACKISSKWTIPGAFYVAGNGDSHIDSTSTVEIVGNQGSGILLKGGKLNIADGADVTITNNEAVKLGFGGGVNVRGNLVLPANAKLYNNHADKAGDDIYNAEGASIQFGDVGSDWVLDDCNDSIDGWYEDGAEDDPGLRWNVHDETKEQHIVEKASGRYTGALALKAAHGESIIPAFGIPILWLNMEDHYSYIIGYPDGTVQPNGKITRAEVATIFFRLLSDDTREAFWSSTNDYSDVPADKWYNNAVSTLSRLGVISGYPDGTFRPDASITRAEFAKIAVSFCKYGSTTYSGCFSDVKASDWFSTCVETARNSNLIAGYPDGTFRPNNAITRAEACTIVNRTLGRKPAKNHMAISGRINWPDCLDTEWFYADMMEATNSHDYQMVGLVEDWNRKLPQRDWAALETEWSHAYSAPGGEVGR